VCACFFSARGRGYIGAGSGCGHGRIWGRAAGTGSVGQEGSLVLLAQKPGELSESWFV